MNITVNDTNISVQTDDTASTYTILTQPDTTNYGNVTMRPWVETYHLPKETVWERFGQCVQNLVGHYEEDLSCGCYVMAFGSLYPLLLSSSQAKNILYYGRETAAPFLEILQDFMTFLQADSSLVSLPRNPFAFSGLANGSWHGAIIDLDVCDSLRTICDAMSKTRQGAAILLYTASNAPAGETALLLRHAVKTIFASCTLYLFTMSAELYDLIYPYTAEALVLTQTEGFLAQMQELMALTQNMEQGTSQPENCLYALELLTQAEQVLWTAYDYLENPKLPVCANTLKEALMDYCTGQYDRTDATVYLENLRQAAQHFYTAIETEFQC